MAKVNIGKCILRKKVSVDGTPASGNWTVLPTPKDGTTNLNPSEGTDIEATIEGGEVIDSISGATNYTLEWEEYDQKGQSPSFIDDNGVVSGEFALQVLPDRDETCPGFQIDRCSIKASTSFTTADGQRTKYTAKVLKPASGNSVKKLNVGGANATGFSLKVGDDVVATQSTTSQPTLTAGSVELTVTGTNLNLSTAAQLLVGNNTINLTKDTANSTATSAKFVGTTSAGDLGAVVLDSVNLIQF